MPDPQETLNKLIEALVWVTAMGGVVLVFGLSIYAAFSALNKIKDVLTRKRRL
jgi:hypothetical protein